MQVDGIINYRKILKSRLAALKQKVSKPELISQRELFNFRWRLFFNARSLLAFSAVCLGLILVLASLPVLNRGLELKKQILGVASTGFEFIEKGDFGQGLQAFAEIEKRIDEQGILLSQILKILPQGQDLEKLVQASSELASSFEILSQIQDEFGNLNFNWNPLDNSSDQGLYFSLKEQRHKAVEALDKLERAAALLADLNPNSVPSEYRGQLVDAQKELRSAYQILQEFVNAQGLLLSLLGGEEKTYVLIFQNNNEARATGGFIGSYGILRFANGRMRIEKIESIYVLDGQLTELIAAPGPMQRMLTRYWGIRDSNWFVDFPTSARKILTFFEKTAKISADGVISFTPDVFEDLLGVTGPIEMPEYGEILTAENFREVVQQKTSLDYNRQLNQPKKFLSDFAPRILGRLMQLEQASWLEVFDILARGVSEKQILMFSVDPRLQTEIANLGLGGEIKRTDADYLAIFHSNLGGGKTDIRIRQQVKKQVIVSENGKALVNLEITRTHEGFSEQFFPKNIDFMRILVPLGSKLVSAMGFDDHPVLPSQIEGTSADADLLFWDSQIKRDESNRIYVGREADYTFFANWLELEPGETKTAEITYELPTAFLKSYTMLLQKQPGAGVFEFDLEVSMPGKPVFRYPESFSGLINADKFYGIVNQ